MLIVLSQPPKRQRIDDLLDYMSDDDNNVPTITTTVTLSEIINDHLSQPCMDRSSDSLQYWNSQQRNLPILANIAADYLTVLPCLPL